MQGPLAFLLFWVVALAVGTTLVIVFVGGGFGWFALVAVPAIVLLLIAFARAGRKH